jgi:hypothetical protein
LADVVPQWVRLVLEGGAGERPLGARTVVEGARRDVAMVERMDKRMLAAPCRASIRQVEMPTCRVQVEEEL